MNKNNKILNQNPEEYEKIFEQYLETFEKNKIIINQNFKTYDIKERDEYIKKSILKLNSIEELDIYIEKSISELNSIKDESNIFKNILKALKINNKDTKINNKDTQINIFYEKIEKIKKDLFKINKYNTKKIKEKEEEKKKIIKISLSVKDYQIYNSKFKKFYKEISRNLVTKKGSISTLFNTKEKVVTYEIGIYYQEFFVNILICKDLIDEYINNLKEKIKILEEEVKIVEKIILEEKENKRILNEPQISKKEYSSLKYKDKRFFKETENLNIYIKKSNQEFFNSLPQNYLSYNSNKKYYNEFITNNDPVGKIIIYRKKKSIEK